MEWNKGENPIAVTSYKMLDGETDIQLPEGIQARTSEHRVRCIYNPSPASIEPVLIGTRTEDYTFVSRTFTKSTTPGIHDYTTITSESEIPQRPKNEPK